MTPQTKALGRSQSFFRVQRDSEVRNLRMAVLEEQLYFSAIESEFQREYDVPKILQLICSSTGTEIEVDLLIWVMPYGLAYNVHKTSRRCSEAMPNYEYDC